MPYVSNKPFASLFPPEPAQHAARRITGDVGDEFRRQVELRTPIATQRQGPVPRGRRRGTARDSIHRGLVRRHRGPLPGYEVDVFSTDPIYRYIEWDTRPHKIRATPPRRALRFFWRGQTVFFREVDHPGTEGQHPFSRSARWISAAVPVIARPGLRAWALETNFRQRTSRF